MKLKQLVIAMSLLPFSVNAQTVPAIDKTASVAPVLAPYQPNVVLDAKELAALRIANEWKNSPDKPAKAADGSVKYLYGATLPTLICSTLQVCEIKLQRGEIINNVHLGDAIRWTADPAETGSGAMAIQSIIVKPMEPGVTTNLIATTDRRSYTIKLISAKNRENWMPSISFHYPDDSERAWANYKEKQRRAVESSTLPTGENIADMDFGFRLSGDNPRWKPVRVYADKNAGKTFIEFHSDKFHDGVPALVALGKNGGLFSGPKEQAVNYRLWGKKFVVDALLEKAILISGVGSEQVRVTIEYTGENQP